MASDQPEVKLHLPLLFKLNDVVEHVKSGGLYVVAGLPTEYVIEATREPAYAYRMKDGRICVRCQSEFEDGRFVYLGSVEDFGYPKEIERGLVPRD